VLPCRYCTVGKLSTNQQNCNMRVPCLNQGSVLIKCYCNEKSVAKIRHCLYINGLV
jgi:hypothetical protein